METEDRVPAGRRGAAARTARGSPSGCRDGPLRPFLLVHGLASNARLWDGVGRRLAAAGHAVAAVDLRGHGRSEAPARPATTPTPAPTTSPPLAEELGFTGGRAPVVAGQSWGGNVVLSLAAAARRRRRASAAWTAAGSGPSAARSRRSRTCWAALAPPAFEGRPVRRPPRPDHGRAPGLAGRGRRRDAGRTCASCPTAASRTGSHPRAPPRDPAVDVPGRPPRRWYPLVRVPVLLVPGGRRRRRAGPVGRSARRRADVAEAAGAAAGRRACSWYVGADHDLHAQHPGRLAADLLALAADAEPDADVEAHGWPGRHGMGDARRHGLRRDRADDGQGAPRGARAASGEGRPCCSTRRSGSSSTPTTSSAGTCAYFAQSVGRRVEVARLAPGGRADRWSGSSRWRCSRAPRGRSPGPAARPTRCAAGGARPCRPRWPASPSAAARSCFGSAAALHARARTRCRSTRSTRSATTRAWVPGSTCSAGSPACGPPSSRTTTTTRAVTTTPGSATSARSGWPRLEGELPDDVGVLGVDEHTALLVDLEARTARVAGNGVVTVRRRAVDDVRRRRGRRAGRARRVLRGEGSAGRRRTPLPAPRRGCRRAATPTAPPSLRAEADGRAARRSTPRWPRATSTAAWPPSWTSTGRSSRGRRTRDVDDADHGPPDAARHDRHVGRAGAGRRPRPARRRWARS